MANLIIVAGQKGGVGKTVVALAIAHYLTKSNRHWWGLDSDPSNQTFADLGGKIEVPATTNTSEPTVAPRVHPVSLYDEVGELRVSSLNAIADAIYEKLAFPETIVIDVGGGQLPTLLAGLTARQIIGATPPLLNVTICYVMVENHAAISTAAHIVHDVESTTDVSWLMVLNERNGPLNKYLLSDFRPSLLAAGVAEVAIPKLRDQEVFERLEESHLSPVEFLAQKKWWSARGQLATWLAQSTANLQAHDAMLIADEFATATAAAIPPDVPADIASAASTRVPTVVGDHDSNPAAAPKRSPARHARTPTAAPQVAQPADTTEMANADDDHDDASPVPAATAAAATAPVRPPQSNGKFIPARQPIANGTTSSGGSGRKLGGPHP